MSASEEFLSLVHLRGELEYAQESYDEFFDENGDVKLDADSESVLDSAERLLLTKEEYRRTVSEYAMTHGVLFTEVDTALDKACDEVARHDREMADIEESMLSKRVVA